jgi:hypothetical protein
MNLAPEHPYLRGFSDDLVMPVSRWTEMRRDEIEAAGLPVLLHSAEVGPALVEDPGHRALYIFNHLEYDSGTLNEEYRRDLDAVQVDGAEIRARALLPRRRPGAHAAEPLAQPCPSALRQLDVGSVPDHALRHRRDRGKDHGSQDRAVKLVLWFPAGARAFAGVTLWKAARHERQAEATWPPEGDFLTIDGHRVHYVVMGEGPDLVLSTAPAATRGISPMRSRVGWPRATA